MSCGLKTMTEYDFEMLFLSAGSMVAEFQIILVETECPL